ncbi:MAG: Rieske 2Fe-2S domain-containing protein [Dehalococcoidia bacterium]
MTEQEKQEQPAEGPPAAEGEAADAEATGATADAAGRRPARKEQAAAPAGPSTAVLARRNVPGEPVVSRRTVLRVGFWASLGAMIAGIGACSLDLVYPRGVTGFGGTVSAGEVSQYPPGSKTQVPEGRFWVVNLTAEQGGPGLLALWWKCPHLGCTVPWRPEFVWPDPTTGAPKKGWFRCPCHGSTYTDAGVRVFGPAPRSMDTMAMTIENGRISVDTGGVTPGGPDNPDRAIRV